MRLDALRGLAVVWMSAFHFCFDLNLHGYIHQQMLGNPVWTWQRDTIVSVFLFCAGMGQALAMRTGQGWARFWRRWAQVAGCALLVTVGSYYMFPQSYIGFGVLHGLAAMLIVARLSGRLGRWLWPLGAIALALPLAAQSLLPGTSFEPVFNGIPLRVLGLVTQKPFTEDYVPIFPWLGVIWWGLACGDWLARERKPWFDGGLAGGHAGKALAWLGRHSLPWYMLHQPLLLGLLAAFALVVPG